MKATFYCDESGNTGTNWVDAEQPFFIYGGWLIPNESKDKVISGVGEIFAKYPGNEIKANRFFKMGKSSEYFKRLFNFMLNIPAFPIFIIIDKFYTVALKIIETFFDPAYNQSLYDEITWDVSLKKQLAEIIREKPLIYSFAKLIHSGMLSPSEMQLIRVELSHAFSLMPSIVKSISCITDDGIRKMLDEFNYPNTSRTLTIPSLNHLMQVLQKFCEGLDSETTIIHDNIRGYNDWLDTLRDLFLSPGDVHILGNNDFQFYSKLPNITELKLTDSKDDILIQIADLLCGFLLKSFLKADKEIPFDDKEKEIMQHLFVLHDEFKTWDYVLPDKQIVKYLNAIGINATEPVKVDYNSLNSAFSQYVRF